MVDFSHHRKRQRIGKEKLYWLSFYDKIDCINRWYLKL